MANRFYISTPIYYPSDRLHIGHTYTTVAADALSRYHRLRGDDTWFLTGTDEHGQKLQRAAAEAGQEPLEYIDPIVDWIKELWDTLEISYDDFIRTTEDRHEKRVQAIFQKLYDQDDIYMGTYEGPYCVDCEAYYTRSQLIDGQLCPVHEDEVEVVAEESYFFRQSRYADGLLQHIKDHPQFIQPETRRHEVISFIEGGLDDLSVSRTSFDWGIPVPFDNNHVIYVWVDALSNYITALDWPDGSKYEKYWPASVHLIGKDILRFHAIIWPSILMALDEPLPEQVFGHGWVLIEGGKMSKARGNVIDPFVLVDKYGIDAVRYYLLREVPFGADGNYSEAALVRRINDDLANDLGNALWRTLSMVERFCGGKVPEPSPDVTDPTLRKKADEVAERVVTNMERLEISKALKAIWELIGRANKYIDERAPWDLNRQNRQAELDTVLYEVLESIRFCAVLLTPFLVSTPRAIWRQLGMEGDPRDLDWQRGTRWGYLPSGQKIIQDEPLFPRLDTDEALAAGANSIDGSAVAANSRASEPGDGDEEAHHMSETVDIETFKQLDLRTAEVIQAEAIEGADKLLKLQLDVGGEPRQVVAGIAEYYEPEQLEGKEVIVITNLEPTTLFGVESQGMVLAASNGNGVKLLTTDGETGSGAKVS